MHLFSGIREEVFFVCLFSFSFFVSLTLQLSGKESVSVGDAGLIPGSGRSPGEGNGNPLQYPCLEKLMDTGAWCTAVYGVAKSQARLSN